MYGKLLKSDKDQQHQYLYKLLNEELPRNEHQQLPMVTGAIELIKVDKVKAAVLKIKINKAERLDRIQAMKKV